MRKIIHIDMDAFYAAVEQRDHPEWRGQPVIVGGPPQSRGVVCTSSYEARKFGVRSAMACSVAFRLCPQGIFAPPRFDVYSKISKEIREIFHEYTDLVEPLSLDEAYLDVTENKKNIPIATDIAKEIRQKIFEKTQLTASAGVSYNKFLAKIASDIKKPDGLYVIRPEQAEAVIEKLSVGTFHGIGKKTEARLKEAGYHTGADLRKLSLEKMHELFGSSGEYFFNMIRGIDNRAVETGRERKSYGNENTFQKDLSNVNEMKDFLKITAEEIFAAVSRQELKAHTATLKVKYADFTQVTRARTLTRPFVSAEEIYTIAAELLDTKTEAMKRPVRLLGISLSGFDEGDELAPPSPQLEFEI